MTPEEEQLELPLGDPPAPCQHSHCERSPKTGWEWGCVHCGHVLTPAEQRELFL